MCVPVPYRALPFPREALIVERRHCLAEAETPDGKRLSLTERAGIHTIEVDGNVLMSTRSPGSERALATSALAEAAKADAPRVLIGGLGMGFTLGAALDLLPSRAQVVVVEYFAAVVEWNHRFRFESEVDRLADPRVQVQIGDVVEVLHSATDRFDAVLLDVDNGPEAWCLSSNARLYSVRGLGRLRRTLTKGGVLAVWSAQNSPRFVSRLEESGFTVRTEVVRSHGTRGERHFLYLAVPGLRVRKPAPERTSRSPRPSRDPKRPLGGQRKRSAKRTRRIE